MLTRTFPLLRSVSSVPSIPNRERPSNSEFSLKQRQCGSERAETQQEIINKTKTISL
jgi:hypothetical protein